VRKIKVLSSNLESWCPERESNHAPSEYTLGELLLMRVAG
jgi:hypothetical protein